MDYRHFQSDFPEVPDTHIELLSYLLLASRADVYSACIRENRPAEHW